MREEVDAKLKALRDDHANRMLGIIQDKKKVDEIEQIFEEMIAPSYLSMMCKLYLENIETIYAETGTGEVADLVIEDMIAGLEELIHPRDDE